jgi:iron complex transport system substrate-binding protein
VIAASTVVALATGPTACAGDANSRNAFAASRSRIEVVDDAGTHVRLDAPAQRVISLIPSANETLVALGAASQIVGRTRYDIAPALATLPSVGGGIDPSIEAIVHLRPDLVVVWENDRRRAVRERLAALHIPTFVLRAEDTTDIYRGIANLGRLTGHDSAARTTAAAMRAALDSIHRSVATLPPRRLMYVEFPEPPMTAGPRTFIGQLVSLVGGASIFADTTALWPNVSMEEIVRRDPDLLVVPVGEFRQNALDRFRKLAGWRDLRAVKDGHVVSVPADLLSRPSPSIVEAARVLRTAIHPELAR